MVLLSTICTQTRRGWLVLLLLLLLLTAILGGTSNGVPSPADEAEPAPGTSETYEQEARNHMCNAQCDAFCYENRLDCGKYCDSAARRQWIFQCNETDGIMKIGFLTLQPQFRVIYSDCPGSCSVLLGIGPGYVPPKPDLVLQRNVQTRSVTLSWATPTTDHSIMYVVEESHLYQNERLTNVHLVLGDEYTHKDIEDVCIKFSYRVAAVSPYGSRWFSGDISTPDLNPGVPADFHSSDIVFDQESQEFHYTLQWSTPRGWWTTDVVMYRSDFDISCPGSLEPVYVFTEEADRVGDTYTMRIRVADNGAGCKISHKVSATSRCREDLTSFWEYVNVDLTCEKIKNIYSGSYCAPPPFNPPGNIRKVQVHVVPSVYGPQTHVSWDPPTDLGSAGVVGNYVVFYGLLDSNLIGFVQDTYHNTTVPGNVHHSVVPAHDYGAGKNFGVMVMAAAPGQHIEAPIGIVFPVEVPDFGEILSPEDEVAVVSIPSSRSVRVYWEPPDAREQPDVQRVALQWGKLKNQDLAVFSDDVHNATTEVSQQKARALYQNLNDTDMDVENATIVEKNSTFYDITDIHSSGLYGVKIMLLSADWEDPSLIAFEDWKATPTHFFKMPEAGTQKVATETTSSTIVSAHSQTPVLAAAITVPLVVTGVAMVIMTWFRWWRREKLVHLLKVERPESRVYTYFLPSHSEETGDDTMNVVADEWELPHSCLQIGRELGSGAFGQVLIGRVSRAMLRHRGLPQDYFSTCSQEYRRGSPDSGDENEFVRVAIKMLKDDCDEKNKTEFLREIRLMKDLGHHPHVVSMLGCCTLREPYCLLVEHISSGDLLKYLKSVRHSLTSTVARGRNYENMDVRSLTSQDILSFARQIALGMEFLSGKGYVHRDLAARNILVGDDNHVKIGDFGLARYVYTDKVYVCRRGGKLPLKWMAVESIFDLTFSTYSDVWSFGVVLFEIVTLGGTPYPTFSVRDLLRALKNGYRMERPDNCSAEIYEIMRACWQEVPSERPTFSKLRHLIQELLVDSSGAQYLNMTVDTNKDYYNCPSDESDLTPDLESFAFPLEDDDNKLYRIALPLRTALDSQDSCRLEKDITDSRASSESEYSCLEGNASEKLRDSSEAVIKSVSESGNNELDQDALRGRTSDNDKKATVNTGLDHFRNLEEKVVHYSDSVTRYAIHSDNITKKRVRHSDIIIEKEILQSEEDQDLSEKMEDEGDQEVDCEGDNEEDGGVNGQVWRIPRSVTGPDALCDDVFEEEESDWEAPAPPRQKRCLTNALRGDCHPRKLLAVPCLFPESATLIQLQTLTCGSRLPRLGSCGESISTSSSSGESIAPYLPLGGQGSAGDGFLSAASLHASLNSHRLDQQQPTKHRHQQTPQLQATRQWQNSEETARMDCAQQQAAGPRRTKVYSRSGGEARDEVLP